MGPEERAAEDFELLVARLRRVQAQARETGRVLQAQLELGARPRLAVVRDLTPEPVRRPR